MQELKSLVIIHPLQKKCEMLSVKAYYHKASNLLSYNKVINDSESDTFVQIHFPKLSYLDMKSYLYSLLYKVKLQHFPNSKCDMSLMQKVKK